ncbi:MAG: hypothetical protein LBU86_01030 [Oscillospiraceae bacterium]|jgi:hypothetical protein|nr:hypothetical protein [Oscillospiraceae bacterium]
MEHNLLAGLDGYEDIRETARSIARILGAEVIYLYNHRIDSSGRLTTCKLAAIAELTDREEGMRRVYREADCELPFDLVIYTPAEWEELTRQKTAFATHIKNTGHIVYEKG